MEREREELPFPLPIFLASCNGGRGVNKCKCSRPLARESRKSRVRTFLISRSRNLEAEEHAKTRCGYAAAPSRAGFETEETSTQKNNLQPKLRLVIATRLFTLATRQVYVLGVLNIQHVFVRATEL